MMRSASTAHREYSDPSTAHTIFMRNSSSFEWADARAKAWVDRNSSCITHAWFVWRVAGGGAHQRGFMQDQLDAAAAFRSKSFSDTGVIVVIWQVEDHGVMGIAVPMQWHPPCEHRMWTTWVREVHGHRRRIA